MLFLRFHLPPWHILRDTNQKEIEHRSGISEGTKEQFKGERRRIFMSSVLKCTTNQHILMCIPTFQIEDRKVGDVDIVNDLNLLMDLPLDSLETHFESEESFLPITRFLANYVSKLYGKNHIRDKLKNNKGMSFLDILTMSDVAYVVTVLWNNLDYWLQLIELDALPQIERDKYLVKNRHKLPKNEWEKYTKKKTRFTSSGGRKKGYLCHGWTAEGVTFYKEKWKMWRRFSANRNVWEKLEIAWETYLSSLGIQEWRENNLDDSGSLEEEEVNRNHFIQFPPKIHSNINFRTLS